MSSLTLTLNDPAFELDVPNALYVTGASIRGELLLDYPRALNENVERVCVELQGFIRTWNRLSHDTEEYKTEKVDIVRKNITLWRRAGGAAPSRGKTLKLPFEFTLPVDAPPSFSFEDYMNAAHVRYAIEATGVRSGPFAFDQTLRIPLVVVVPDPLGSSLRPQLKLGWQDGWGRMRMEREIRRNPWGPWSTAKLELLVPHLDTFPLFTYIPFTILLTTLSAPMKVNLKETPGPPPPPLEKDQYPPTIRDASYLSCELRRAVDMNVTYMMSNPEEHVADFIANEMPIPSAAPVDAEIGPRVWVADGEVEGRGRWVQETTFRSSMYLRCTPSFLTEQIKVKYMLVVKAEFPGQGSVVKLELPINLGSGVLSSVPLSGEVNPSSPWMVDLPPSYWKPHSWSD